jgi:hypothetical protein
VTLVEGPPHVRGDDGAEARAGADSRREADGTPKGLARSRSAKPRRSTVTSKGRSRHRRGGDMEGTAIRVGVYELHNELVCSTLADSRCSQEPPGS